MNKQLQQKEINQSHTRRGHGGSVGMARASSTEEFLKIQAAYEALTQPLSVGEMLKAADRTSTT